MAGPGDKYAKDTRAYNPEFAAKAGDEADYDKKIQEVSYHHHHDIRIYIVIPY